MGNVTNKTKELVDRWKSASRRAEIVRAELNEALRELQSSEENLAMWLLPEDAKEGEQFCVWYGDSLISVKELHEGYEVVTRKRGKSLLI